MTPLRDVAVTTSKTSSGRPVLDLGVSADEGVMPVSESVERPGRIELL